MTSFNLTMTDVKPALPPALNTGALDTDTLVGLRSKLVLLIESLQMLQMMIADGGSQAMPSWPDIVARYTLLLAMTRAIMTQLTAPPLNASEDNSDAKWHKSLAKVAVHPIQSIPQSLDYQVGILLNTRQPLTTDERAKELIKKLPLHLQATPPNIQQNAANQSGIDQDLIKAKSQTINNLVRAHNSTTAKAQKHAARLRHSAQHVDDLFGSDDESDTEVEEYDWNMRLPKFKDPAEDLSLNLADVAAFLRDGRGQS